MTKNLYRTLNNYDYSDENIEIIKQYVLSVATLNDRVLVPIGEYRFRGSFHGMPH